MTVRNFWVTINVDGKKEPVSTGPQASDGGMIINLFVKDKGESKHAVTLECNEEDGELIILIEAPDEKTDTFKFKR